MLDIIYVGNSSYDEITRNEKQHKVIGGSSIYSAISSRYVNNKIKIGIITSFVDDFNLDVLTENNIKILNKSTDPISNIFVINEDKDNCFLKDKNYVDFELPSKEVKTNHLHISFRKGVPVEALFESQLIDFNTLSIDVMHYSINEFLELIKKYKDKIDIIFCNEKERKILEKEIKKLPSLVVTNEEKTINYFENGQNLSIDILKVEKVNIKSHTGLGDTFIGAFLGEYLKERSIYNSICIGATLAHLSTKRVGALDTLNIKRENYFLLLERIKLLNKIPKFIIIIGMSCSGKSTFANYINDYFYNAYTDTDDYGPLKEVFEMCDCVIENSRHKFDLLHDNIYYTDDIFKEYQNNFDKKNLYAIKTKDGGHDIVRLDLWDKIIKYSIEKLDFSKRNIFQFSRGLVKPGKYDYDSAFKIIFDAIPDDIKNQTLIVNVTSDLNIRKERNVKRKQEGGHYVSEEVLNTVYKEDIFSFDSNTYTVNGDLRIPVYEIINNKELSDIERNEFFCYNIKEIIKKYGGKYD